MLLSNKWRDGFSAKYSLDHIVRVHNGSDDESYKAVFQEEDNDGFIGVSLSTELMNVVGKALRENFIKLGPLVLPWLEKLKYVFNKMVGEQTFVPDFKKAFDHFCIHAGGRGVIDGLEKKLNLEPKHVEPSRAVLHKYGNTSSSSIWYELNYIEENGLIGRGQRVCQVSHQRTYYSFVFTSVTLQIAFGSGFQCNTCVLTRLKN